MRKKKNKNQSTVADDLYEKCKSIFGIDSLVVQSSRYECIFENETQKLEGLYAEKFEDPAFNPRWAHGTADHTVVFEIKELSKAR